MKRILLATLLAVALIPAVPWAAELDDIEQSIVRSINEREPVALALLETSVNINSGTMNFAGVREVGDLFEAEFAELGFETEWIDGAGFGRAGHLIARRGSGDLHVLLIGHLDTVFAADSPFQTYERISETHARGPGTTDMKGGNIVMLEALRALDAVGELDAIQVTAILTGDEEASGRPLTKSRVDLIEAARAADFAFGFEDGDGRPETIVISRRGSTSWRLEATGIPSHSSQVFSEQIGFGAVYELARILDAFRVQLSDEQFLTFNPGLVLGGTEIESEGFAGRAFGKNNVVAQTAIATGDIRTISPDQLELARERMSEIVSDHLPGTSATITFNEGYPPLAPTDGNRKLLAIYDLVSQDLGYGSVEAVDPRNAGAADVSFTSGLVDGALCGLGLMGTAGHTVDETADLRTLRSQTHRFALLLHRMLRE